MRTIGDKLEETRGIGAGFDFLRVLLSCSVVLWHEVPVVLGDHEYQPTFFWFWGGYGILAAFFGLSGFLITGSALRLTLSNFLINRGLRIVPALAVEVVLSAFLLGPFFTVLSLSEYLADPQTFHYLTNIVGLINYELPGVFIHNPSRQVNWALWTVPYEIGCYAAMSVLVLLGLLKRPFAIVVIIAIFMLIGLVGPRLLYPHIEWALVRNSLFLMFSYVGARLYVCFLLGIAIYLYRDSIPYDWRLFAMCVAYLCAISFLGPTRILVDHKVLNAVVSVPLMYVVAFIGVTRIPELPVFNSGDYSYGIYLYGLPIQQSLRAAVPSLSPWAHAILALPLIVLVAALSWHLIEKPILGMRKRFSFVARVRGVS